MPKPVRIDWKKIASMALIRVAEMEQALQRIEGHTSPSNAPIDAKWINSIATQALKG